MKIDVGVEIHPGVQEHLEGRKAGFMNGKSFLRHDRVMNQPRQIDRADRHAAHIGIPQDIVQIIAGVTSGDHRLKHVQPTREAGIVLAFLLEDQMGNLVGIQFFPFREGAGTGFGGFS